MRGPTNSDYNVLLAPKCSALPEEPTEPLEKPKTDALILYTVFNGVSWKKGALARHSQHVVLASQTLGDLFEIIACSSNEMPHEVTETQNGESRVVGFEASGPDSGGACICIEGVAYGDGMSAHDYSE